MGIFNIAIEPMKRNFVLFSQVSTELSTGDLTMLKPPGSTAAAIEARA